MICCSVFDHEFTIPYYVPFPLIYAFENPVACFNKPFNALSIE